jgi:hypothetical protein
MRAFTVACLIVLVLPSALPGSLTISCSSQQRKHSPNQLHEFSRLVSSFFDSFQSMPDLSVAVDQEITQCV